ncbi:hypothetical protein WHR41_05391 [Cladosporium halotolerans]|uniref:Heme haloperoxidase family profile domain-containing protein n=1 Tax=Cladosporium halotolerans TaxID=1052096 RepID=A0AB34KPV2_9PEZI
MKVATISALIGSTAAFPGLLNLGGDGKLLDLSGLSDLSVLELNQQKTKNNTYPAADPKNCPFNHDHKPAAKWNPDFPYSHAKNGLPGNGKGGYQVPMPGDEDHKFIAPGKNDIRGPCPGMNMLANHGFIARDGITNFQESVDACQNVFNMNWDLATVITLIALVLGDGDVLSQKFSIGCDATSRTAAVELIAGSQPGLNGHGNFEVDASMSRDDYFLAEGDAFTLNVTLFAQMVETTGGQFTQSGISSLKHQRWHQSQQENPNFFFGPIGLISYAASAFLPELYGDGKSASTETVATFFGVHQQDDGSWIYGHNESIPEGWTSRKEPYGLVGVVENFLKMYLEKPVLFGGNTADGHFDGLDFGAIKDGKIDAAISVDDTLCLVYQLLLWPVPGLLNGVLDIGTDALELVTSTLGSTLTDLGCPAPVNAS